MKSPHISLLVPVLAALSLSACQQHAEEAHHVVHRITATTPIAKSVTITRQYVCQIHSFRHIEVRALEEGFLEEIKIKEGQAVKKGETLYQIMAVLYQAKLDSERAEANYAQMELNNTRKLFQDKVVSEKEVALLEAKLARALAKVKQAEAELNFTTLKAPFDGIVDHQHHQQGSLIEAGDILTTLSDNSLMWVYFNVPEARYLEYMENTNRNDEDLHVELVLANGKKFNQAGKIGAIEADFNNQTGNIAFRADFPNPDRLLRHGQTGTVLLSRELPNAIVIPQRATFEILAKKYVYVIEKDDGTHHDESHGGHAPASVADHGAAHAGQVLTHAAQPGVASAAEHHDHDDKAKTDGHGHEESHGPLERGVVRQHEIQVLNELDDIYVVSGLNVNDKFVLEGSRQVREGDVVEYEPISAEQALANLKFHAE